MKDSMRQLLLHKDALTLKVSSIRINNVTGDALLYTPHHFGVNAFRRFYSKSHKVMFLC